ARALVAEPAFDPASAALTVSISANDYIQSTLLVPFIQCLRRDAPNARLAVRNPPARDIPALLADAELDLCIATTPDVPDADVRSRLLYEERYVGVVRSGHPLKSGAVTLERFCRFPHAMVSPSEGRFVGPVDRALAKAGRHRRVVLSAPGFLV